MSNRTDQKAKLTLHFCVPLQMILHRVSLELQNTARRTRSLTDGHHLAVLNPHPPPDPKKELVGVGLRLTKSDKSLQY